MVAPIGPIQIPSVGGASSLAGAGGAKARTEQVESTSFGQAVGDAISKIGTQEAAMEKAAEAAATGDLRSVSDYMVAATEAQLTTEITVAVRDRAISAFNDIMRMQL
jgi:flagellar hook-basal body complex protein FliE